MRHGDKINNLGRTESHRRALLANLAIALIEHKRITTTLAKAKALRRYAEPLITKAKDNSTHSRRVVFSYLQNKEALKELFGTVAEKVGERPGGYLRIIKLGFRRGDGAETAMIEFVDFNETYNPNEGKVRQAKKTRRGGSKKAAADAAQALAAADVFDGGHLPQDSVVDEIEETMEAAPEEVVEMPEVIETKAEEVVEAAAEVAAPVEEAVEEVAEEAVAEVEAGAEEVSDSADVSADDSEEKKDEEEQA